MTMSVVMSVVTNKLHSSRTVALSTAEILGQTMGDAVSNLVRLAEATQQA